MPHPRRIDLAEPMSGLPGHNVDAFHDPAHRLTDAGWAVVNPAANFGRRSDTLYTIPIMADRCILPDGREVAA